MPKALLQLSFGSLTHIHRHTERLTQTHTRTQSVAQAQIVMSFGEQWDTKMAFSPQNWPRFRLNCARCDARGRLNGSLGRTWLIKLLPRKCLCVCVGPCHDSLKPTLPYKLTRHSTTRAPVPPTYQCLFPLPRWGTHKLMHIQKTKPYTLLINLSSAESELQVAIHSNSSSSSSRQQTNAAKTKDQQTKTTARERQREEGRGR